MKVAKDFLNVELKDDCKSEGGVSYQGETLQNFLDECNIPYNTPIDVVDAYLIANGIMPIGGRSYVQQIEDKLVTYMGENDIVCLDKEETKTLFNDLIEGFFANYKIMNTDLDTIYQINEMLWEDKGVNNYD